MSSLVALDKQLWPQVEGPPSHREVQEGARRLLQAAIENEVAEYIGRFKELKNEKGHRMVTCQLSLCTSIPTYTSFALITFLAACPVVLLATLFVFFRVYQYPSEGTQSIIGSTKAELPAVAPCEEPFENTYLLRKTFDPLFLSAVQCPPYGLCEFLLHHGFHDKLADADFLCLVG